MPTKLSAEQRIEKVHVTLMRHPQFCLFSGLFMVGKVYVKDDVRTAFTNGVDVSYGRAFVDRLTDKQLAFLVLHENMHKAYRHLSTWEKLWKKNPQLANAACDFVVNLQIQDYDPNELMVSMPTNEAGELMGCIDEKFRGMDAQQVFSILEKEAQQSSKDGDSEDGVAGVGNQNGNKTTPRRDVPEGFDEHDWGSANELSEEEAEAIAKEIDNAMRQGALLAGKFGSALSREIQDLLTAKIDWREALRDFVKQLARGRDDSSWRRFSRRMLSAGILMPQSVSQRLGCIAVGIDTSGSIGGELLTEFLSELQSICQEVSPNKVELLYWDSRVAQHETYEDGAIETLVESTKPKGGGGTDPDCVVRYMKTRNIAPDCIVMLTDGCFYDGEGGWDEIGAPLIWCVKDNKNFTHKFGKAVHI